MEITRIASFDCYFDKVKKIIEFYDACKYLNKSGFFNIFWFNNLSSIYLSFQYI